MLLIDYLKPAHLIVGFLLLSIIIAQSAHAERPAPKPSAASLQERMGEMSGRAKACARRRVDMHCSRGDLVDSSSLCSRLNTCISACEAADKPQQPSRVPPRYKQGPGTSPAERCSAAYGSVTAELD